MSDELTIDGKVDAALITGLVDLARRVDAAKKSSDDLAESAKKQSGAWQSAEAGFQRFLGRAKEFWESSSRFGEAYRNIKEPLGDIAEGLLGAAESTARLAAEQSRLDRTQQDLNVSLRHAQDYAGGFARETDIATAAITLQGQGLRVTQQELDALTRLGMRRAADTSKEFAEVMESVTETVFEGGDELGKLAPELLAVADGSHTAGERLAAMVTAAERAGPAVRDARTEMERYGAAVESTQRQIAAGFVEELTHLSQITSKTQDAREATEEWERSMRAVGSTVALLGSGAVNALGAIAGTIATAVATVPALLEGAGAAVAEFTMNPQNIANGTAGRRAGAAFRASMNNDTLTSLTSFVEDRVAALEALAGESDSRTSATPETVRTPDAATRRRDRRMRTTSSDALGGGDANTDDGADRGKKFARRDALRASEADYDARVSSVDSLIAAERERQDRETERTTAEKSTRDTRAREAEAARREAQRRMDAEQDLRSNSGQLREFFREQTTDANAMADAVTGAYQQMTDAAAGHFEALVTGRETGAQALEGFAADTIGALAKISAKEAIYETAKGLAALFVNPAAAATHFASAATFGVLAVGTGLASQALPSGAGRGGASGGGASNGPREAPLQSRANASGGGGTVINNITFGGGVVMGTPRELTEHLGDLMNDPVNGFTLNPRRVG